MDMIESGGYESCPHTFDELRSAAYQKDYAYDCIHIWMYAHCKLLI